MSFDMATRDLRTRIGQPAHFIRLPDALGKGTDSDLRFDSGPAPTPVGRSGPPRQAA